jgi:hypothetical protein
MNCENCGTKKRNGICTNCHEELYINDYQMPQNPIPVSNEWNEAVRKQREYYEAEKQCANSGHQLVDCYYCIHSKGYSDK